MARRAGPSTPVRRRRTLLGALAGLLAAGGIGAGLLVAGGGRTPPATRAPVSGRPSRPSPSTTVPPPLRSLAVESTSLDLADPSRPLTEGGTELAGSRPLPTTVWFPTAPGRYPLVVFASGYDVGPATYQRFCATLASAGYVVAAPSFPLEDPAQGHPLDRADLPNEAGDVAFVIGQLTTGSLAGRVDGTRVAVVGHSDGADVALMVGYEQGTTDPRPAAFVALAPDPVGVPLATVTRPLLLVQGSADSVVPYSASQSVFETLAQAGGAVWYVTLVGADHLPPVVGGTPWTPVLDQDVAAFLDATVAGRGSGRAALAGALSGSPLEQLQTSPAARPTAG